MRDILRLLDASAKATADKETFVRAQIVFWMLAATDGHAKNLSIFHGRGGTYRFTPLYYILSTWPIVGRGRDQLEYRKLALPMAVRSKNVHWKLSEIRSRHWDAVASQAGLRDATRFVQELMQETPRVIARAAGQVPPGFPSRVSDTILHGLQESAQQ